MEGGIDSLNVGVTSGILAFCARVLRKTWCTFPRWHPTRRKPS